MLSLNNLLDNFDVDKYEHLNNIKLVDDFIIIYEKIQSKDSIKPLFSITNKYNNFNNKFKSKKKVWAKEKPSSLIENIKMKVISNLNKVSENTFNNIFENIANILKNVKDVKILEIISKEIYFKTVYDLKYQNLYLNILQKLNKISIHKNFTNIIKEGNKLYWKFNNKSEKNGPFNNYSELEKNIIKNISLKKIFINLVQEEFNNKSIYLNDLNQETEDEKKYNIKRKIIGNIEIITKLYLSNEIPILILNIVLINLLNDKKNDININIECFHNIFKILHSNKINIKLNKFFMKNHLLEYKENISNLSNKDIKGRTSFLLLDITEFIEKLLNLNDKKINKFDYNEIQNEISKKIKNFNTNFLVEYFIKYKKNSNDLITILFEILFENQKYEKIIIDIFVKLYKKRLIYNKVLNDVYKEIDKSIIDLELEIPGIKNTYNNIKTKINKIINFKIL